MLRLVRDTVDQDTVRIYDTSTMTTTGRTETRYHMITTIHIDFVEPTFGPDAAESLEEFNGDILIMADARVP